MHIHTSIFVFILVFSKSNMQCNWQPLCSHAEIAVAVSKYRNVSLSSQAELPDSFWGGEWRRSLSEKSVDSKSDYYFDLIKCNVHTERGA